MTSEEERERQVMAFNQATRSAHELGLPIVSITPHTARCVAHYIEEAAHFIEEANERLSANERDLKTLMLNVEVLGNELKAQYRNIAEMEREADNETGEYLEMIERIG